MGLVHIHCALLGKQRLAGLLVGDTNTSKERHDALLEWIGVAIGRLLNEILQYGCPIDLLRQKVSQVPNNP